MGQVVNSAEIESDANAAHGDGGGDVEEIDTGFLGLFVVARDQAELPVRMTFFQVTNLSIEKLHGGQPFAPWGVDDEEPR